MNKGVLFGIAAYLIWGFLPIYLKAVKTVPDVQILLHRVVWAFVFVLLLVLWQKRWPKIRKSLRNPRVGLTYALTALLLVLNWLVYIYGVNSEQVIETSLGYFINPLLNVALGVIILREHLRPLQWLPVGLAGMGVLYLTLQYGSLPWIALALAFSFGMYGLIKKIAPLGAVDSLFVETGIIFFPALLYLLFSDSQGSGAFVHQGWGISILLVFSGLVTALPLLFFGRAARSIPLSLLGILQYIAPTVQFLLGVFIYREPFTLTRLIGFSTIWIALLIYTLEGFYNRGKRTIPASVP